MATAILSPRAERDLIDLWLFIAQDSPEAADRILDRINQAIDLLVRFPQIGHVRDDLADSRYRFWAVGPYLIIYRSQTNPLQIVRVWHTARDVPEL